MKYLLLLLVTLTLAGCDDWNAEAPPRDNDSQRTVSIPQSNIGVDISVNTADVEANMMAKYQSTPLTAGRSGEINAKLLVEEKSVKDMVVDRVVTPFKAAGCLTKQVAAQCPQNIVKNVAKNCITNIFHKPGKCFETIVETVYVPCLKDATECWPEVKEVVQSEIQPFIELKEKLSPTTIWINHKVFLTSVDIDAQGSDIKVAGDLRVEVSVDVKQGLLGADVTVKGALACDVTTHVTAVVGTEILPSPAINVKAKEFGLDIKKICLPGAVELLDAGLFDISLYIQKEILSKAVETALLSIVNKQLKQGIGDKLQFSDRVAEISKLAAQPIAMGSDLWIATHVEQVALSQFVGSGQAQDNKLALALRVAARPAIVFGSKPPAGQETLPIVLANDIASSFSLSVEGKVELKPASNLAHAEIVKFLDERYPAAPLTVSEVEFYQSGQRIVIGLTFATRPSLGVEGSVYLTARPYLDLDAQEVRVADVRFDGDSTRVLLKTAAWFDGRSLEQIIEDKLRFHYAGPLQEVKTGVTNFQQKSVELELNGTISRLTPKDIWIADDAIHLWALAEGTLSATVRPDL